MVFSVIGAVILGGTLAWTNSKSFLNNQVNVGSLAFDAVYNQAPNALLGPDGVTTTVGHVAVQNNGQYNIQVVGTNPADPASSKVVIRNVAPAPGHSVCDPVNFTGSVDATRPLPIAPGEHDVASAYVEDAGTVYITVNNGSPSACQGATVTYDVIFVVSSTSNS